MKTSSNLFRFRIKSFFVTKVKTIFMKKWRRQRRRQRKASEFHRFPEFYFWSRVIPVASPLRDVSSRRIPIVNNFSQIINFGDLYSYRRDGCVGGISVAFVKPELFLG